ncbi:hypothetical protein EIN_372330 [Entamoeba invadens IP1]|uniref:TLDc domain-containing protein n=1 Tax=Entamoeba invadens IP1 TaxID=370355 RepID=A0A0A1UC39_ENTIV|nr:hypothetical protein EIN_372330 [Entamoeba invadens IP1]ELP92811.1 hypothetical protein EIN_372330 [Entamoeba invadens IP1]|eukprot:XP_004259582.1 hypothetical protein EIN_372330 [Entamoeba invadens IP1]
MSEDDKRDFSSLVTKLGEMVTLLTETQKEAQNYLEFIGQDSTRKLPNETTQQAIDKIENLLNNINNINEKRKNVIQVSENAIGVIKTTLSFVEDLVNTSKQNETRDAETSNELIKKVIYLEEEKMKEEIKPKNDWILNRKKEFEERRKQLETSFLNTNLFEKTHEILSIADLRKIEEWTSMKATDVIFDSLTDNFEKTKNDFAEKVFNQESILLVIEDTKGNKFGGFVKTKINEREKYLYDQNGFVFSLVSKTKLTTPTKFLSTDQNSQFMLYGDTNEELCGVGGGHDIALFKKGSGQCYCDQYSFDYKGMSNVLCGSQNFVPKHFIVVQMKDLSEVQNNVIQQV